MDEKPSVYRCYSKGKGLLYIGSTINLQSRMREHRGGVNSILWISKCCEIRVEYFENIKDAREAESSAIMSENPKYNKNLRSTKRLNSSSARAKGRSGSAPVDLEHYFPHGYKIKMYHKMWAKAKARLK